MYNVDRSSKQQFYQSKEWVQVRNFKRVANPYCEICERVNGLIVPMSEVDHIQDIDELPRSRWLEIDNLQSLCKPCHSAKSITRHKQKVKEAKDNQPSEEQKILLKAFGLLGAIPTS